MLILDRYVLRQFVQIFVICFLSLTGLYVVIDLFGHLDHFSSYAEREGNLLGVIANYYGYRTLAFFDRTSGILAMISAMFTVTWLQSRQESTAMLAAGISKFRIVKPLLAAAAVISLAGVANRELVIPRYREELAKDTKDLGGDSARPLEARFDSQTDVLIGGEQVVLAERRIVRPAFVLPSELALYGKQLIAREARYVDPTDGRPSGFVLSGVSAPPRITQYASLRLGEAPVVVTPVDADWLAADEVFVVSRLPFQMLADGSAWRNYASTGALVAELNRPSTDLGSDVRVTVHARMLQPLMDGTLLMLGLPLMFARSNRNIFVSIGICLLVATAFSLVTLACQAFGGLNLLRPSLAAWLPLMLFVPVATMMAHALLT
jgi:lipopolysaccharide export system permease protein